MNKEIALIILLVVMFSALSGRLTFLTAGSMGERNAPNLERLLK